MTKTTTPPRQESSGMGPPGGRRGGEGGGAGAGGTGVRAGSAGSGGSGAGGGTGTAARFAPGSPHGDSHTSPPGNQTFAHTVGNNITKEGAVSHTLAGGSRESSGLGVAGAGVTSSPAPAANQYSRSEQQIVKRVAAPAVTTSERTVRFNPVVEILECPRRRCNRGGNPSPLTSPSLLPTSPPTSRRASRTRGALGLKSPPHRSPTPPPSQRRINRGLLGGTGVRLESPGVCINRKQLQRMPSPLGQQQVVGFQGPVRLAWRALAGRCAPRPPPNLRPLRRRAPSFTTSPTGLLPRSRKRPTLGTIYSPKTSPTALTTVTPGPASSTCTPTDSRTPSPPSTPSGLRGGELPHAGPCPSPDISLEPSKTAIPLPPPPQRTPSTRPASPPPQKPSADQTDPAPPASGAGKTTNATTPVPHTSSNSSFDSSECDSDDARTNFLAGAKTIQPPKTRAGAVSTMTSVALARARAASLVARAGVIDTTPPAPPPSRASDCTTAVSNTSHNTVTPSPSLFVPAPKVVSGGQEEGDVTSRGTTRDMIDSSNSAPAMVMALLHPLPLPSGGSTSLSCTHTAGQPSTPCTPVTKSAPPSARNPAPAPPSPPFSAPTGQGHARNPSTSTGSDPSPGRLENESPTRCSTESPAGIGLSPGRNSAPSSPKGARIAVQMETTSPPKSRQGYASPTPVQRGRPVPLLPMPVKIAQDFTMIPASSGCAIGKDHKRPASSQFGRTANNLLVSVGKENSSPNFAQAMNNAASSTPKPATKSSIEVTGGGVPMLGGSSNISGVSLADFLSRTRTTPLGEQAESILKLAKERNLVQPPPTPSNDSPRTDLSPSSSSSPCGDHLETRDHVTLQPEKKQNVVTAESSLIESKNALERAKAGGEPNLSKNSSPPRMSSMSANIRKLAMRGNKHFDFKKMTNKEKLLPPRLGDEKGDRIERNERRHQGKDSNEIYNSKDKSPSGNLINSMFKGTQSKGPTKRKAQRLSADRERRKDKEEDKDGASDSTVSPQSLSPIPSAAKSRTANVTPTIGSIGGENDDAVMTARVVSGAKPCRLSGGAPEKNVTPLSPPPSTSSVQPLASMQSSNSMLNAESTRAERRKKKRSQEENSQKSSKGKGKERDKTKKQGTGKASKKRDDGSFKTTIKGSFSRDVKPRRSLSLTELGRTLRSGCWTLVEACIRGAKTTSTGNPPQLTVVFRAKGSGGPTLGGQTFRTPPTPPATSSSQQWQWSRPTRLTSASTTSRLSMMSGGYVPCASSPSGSMGPSGLRRTPSTRGSSAGSGRDLRRARQQAAGPVAGVSPSGGGRTTRRRGTGPRCGTGLNRTRRPNTPARRRVTSGLVRLRGPRRGRVRTTTTTTTGRESRGTAGSNSRLRTRQNRTTQAPASRRSTRAAPPRRSRGSAVSLAGRRSRLTVPSQSNARNRPSRPSSRNYPRTR